jgi:hypothetical protein
MRLRAGSGVRPGIVYAGVESDLTNLSDGEYEPGAGAFISIFSPYRCAIVNAAPRGSGFSGVYAPAPGV